MYPIKLKIMYYFTYKNSFSCFIYVSIFLNKEFFFEGVRE